MTLVAHDAVGPAWVTTQAGLLLRPDCRRRRRSRNCSAMPACQPLKATRRSTVHISSRPTSARTPGHEFSRPQKIEPLVPIKGVLGNSLRPRKSADLSLLLL